MAWAGSAVGDAEEPCYELYHENSKIGRRVRPLPLHESRATEESEGEDDQYPLFSIGEASPLPASVGDTLTKAPPDPEDGRLSMRALSALLPRRTAVERELLEIYFNVRAVDGLPPGLYRLGDRGSARLIRRGDLGRELAVTLLTPEPAATPLQILIAGAFARAAVGSGERGYRLALLTAGARAREVALVAAALDLGMGATAEFYDRELDAFLGLDGVDKGVLLLIAVGPAT